jgi:hypothetical protein
MVDTPVVDQDSASLPLPRPAAMKIKLLVELNMCEQISLHGKLGVAAVTCRYGRPAINPGDTLTTAREDLHYLPIR